MVDEGDRVVVVGSGPSGATAARELVAQGVDVLLLESGVRPPAGLLIRAAGHTVLRRRAQSELRLDAGVDPLDPRTDWYRTLAPGGLSNYWTAAVPRFCPGDFTDGRRLDERFAWPLSYDELVPFYEDVERLLCITGSAKELPLLPAGIRRYEVQVPGDWQQLADEAGASGLMAMLPLARGRRWMAVRRGSEFNSFHVLVQPLLTAQRGFELRCGAHATRLIGASQDGSVEGVEYLDQLTGQRSVVRCRAVVLAAGAIDTARLLLDSTTAAHPAGVGNDRGLVGRYLHDHPQEWWPVEMRRELTTLYHPLYITRRPFEETEPLDGHSMTLLAHERWTPVGALRRRRTASLGVQVFSTIVPDPDGRMSLAAGQLDEFGVSRVRIALRYSERSIARLETSRRRFESITAAGGVPGRVTEIPHAPRPGNSVHFAGTARMHEDPAFGVTDRWGRLHDTPNVVVADMSTFTTSPEKNPTLTSMALAARAARHLAETLRGRPTA